MRDERDRELDALFSLVRHAPADTSALEKHFETRLMARLAERRVGQSAWQMLVWRLMPAFAVLAAVLLIISLTLNPDRSGDPFAAITSGYEDQMARNYLPGGN